MKTNTLAVACISMVAARLKSGTEPMPNLSPVPLESIPPSSAPIMVPARRRRNRHGERNLVDALHRNGGFAASGLGAFRLADSLVVDPGGNCCLSRGTFCGEPQDDGRAGSPDRQHHDGSRHCYYAFHRNGGDAGAGDGPVYTKPRGFNGGPGYFVFGCGALSHISVPRGNHERGMAKGWLRTHHGCRDPCHTLRWHGFGQLCSDAHRG